MKVLVTGATGIVGTAAVEALLARGQSVRLLSRGAAKRAHEWPDECEAHAADVGDAGDLRGAAEGCDAVLHIAGILLEDPPKRTYERINIGGTRNVLEEAKRAGVQRFVYVSSLGSERGGTEYQRSKLAGERLVREFDGNWTIARLANVYGPGDAVVSLLLKVIRATPVVPLIDWGDDAFQPIWHRDAGQALAILVEREDLGGRAIELAGGELTTMRDLIERFARITGREPVQVPVPAGLAILGGKLASLLNIDLPVSDQQVTMLLEGSVVGPEGNGLKQLGIMPTRLEEGLRELADSMPEQLPTDGIGGLKRKRYWADIHAGDRSARELCDLFRRRFGEVMPAEVGAEPGTGETLDEGETITLALPLRGNVQVRCHEVTDDAVTLITVSGHPLAGAVRFCFQAMKGATRFEVQVFDRAADVVDLIAMRALGDHLQDRNWEETVRRMVELSGGEARDGVQHEEEDLTEEDAAEVNTWLTGLVGETRRENRE